jgi:hypothetical protein
VIMAKVKLRVTDNTSLNVEGTIYRAGDVFGLERDDTAKQLLSAGSVTEVKVRRGVPGATPLGSERPGVELPAEVDRPGVSLTDAVGDRETSPPFRQEVDS